MTPNPSRRTDEANERHEANATHDGHETNEANTAYVFSGLVATCAQSSFRCVKSSPHGSDPLFMAQTDRKVTDGIAAI